MSPTDGSSDLALLTNWINDKKEAGIANSEDQLIVCFEQGHRSWQMREVDIKGKVKTINDLFYHCLDDC